MVMTHKNTNCGFTLIELSIVIVIIGLLVGGIMLGKSLVRQAQVNSAMSDEQKYVQAVASFQQKYGALPGDFASATSYWTAAGTCPPTSGIPATTTTTCSGDGNGQIGTSGTSTNQPSEDFLFWQHLALAQMIPGSFNGTTGGGGGATTDHIIGTNSPATKIDGAGFGVTWVGIVTSGSAGTTYPSNTYPANNLGHVFVFGAYSSNNLPAAAILTPAEAFAIDTRYDDGVPGTGNILTWLTTASASYANACETNTTAYATTSGYQCSLIFVTGF